MCIKKLCQYARCVKMLNNNNCAIGYISLMIYFLVFLGFTDMTEAGACWVARMSNGKCKELFSKNVSRDECCKYGQEFAYTDTDMSDVEYFFAAAIGDGATCVSCLDSCDVAKCGIGKRCIIRKGRPKCVCAPICKASKDKKMKKNHNNNSNSNRTDDNNNSVRVVEHEKLKQLNTFNNVPRNRQIFDLSSNAGQNQEQKQQQQQINQNQQNNEQNQQQNFNRDWFPIPVSLTIPAPAASSKIQVSIESIPLYIPDNNKEKQKHKNKQKQTEKFNTIVINNNTNVTIIENKKRKNQRKSDLTKRKNQNSGKFSTDDTIIKNHNDKRIKLNNNDNNNNNNNNGIINDSKRANHSTKLERTIKLKKNLNTKTKNIVIVKSNPSESDIVTENVLQDDLEQQQQQQKHKQQQHHNRHEYKKKRKLQKQQRFQHNASQNLTTPINNADFTTSITTIMNTNINSRKYHQQQQQKRRRPISNRMENTKIDHSINMVTTTTTRTIHQEHNYYNQMTLDEKIRNGFFNHGFPYNQLYSTEQQQMTHGRYYNPVCGTDGKTYKTECQLKKRACRRETSLTVAYRGHCQTSCKLVHCLDGLTCVEDQYGIPHCISCTISCPQDDVISDVIDPTRAVCGVDGRTYKSICDINRMICITGRSIAVAYYGPCQESANCNNIHCGQRKICLTDLVTHKPRCISCSFKCPRKRRPQGQKYEDVKICGNNNHTYYSWCHMRRDSCNTEFYIDVKHVGPCHKDSFKRDEKLPQFY